MRLNKKSDQWVHIVTRETSLYERCLRLQGYREMFGKDSKYKISKILVVSKDGLNEQYFNANELKKNDLILLKEFKSGVYKKLKQNWHNFPKEIDKNLNVFLKIPVSNNYKNFLKIYKYGRAVVLYTEELAKVLNKRGIKGDFKELGNFHEMAETKTSFAWDKAKKILFKINSQAVNYTPHELSKFIANKRRVNSNILSKRKKYYVMLADKDFKIFYDMQAQIIEERQLCKSKDIKVSEIKGQIAYRGHVEGRVRIVNTVAQMKSMKKDEVLVSIMTTPRLTEAFRKAIAVVTDEGGVICHASIVAREMNKPCIIGTKIATKVLKDGDLVEVDAIHGVVTILKKVN